MRHILFFDMLLVDLLLCLPNYKCFPQTNPLNLHNHLSGEFSSSHDTDDERGSEGLRNPLKVTQPASERAGFEPCALIHFNAALYRGYRSRHQIPGS